MTRRNHVTFTRKGKMLTGRKASLYSAVRRPFTALGSSLEARRNARSARRVDKRLSKKKR